MAEKEKKSASKREEKNLTQKTPAVDKKSASSNSKKDFLVVGLGASAGGVRALQEFFAAMPGNSGMAFVAILHLSPEHESNLAQILQARTQMKVTQVTETVKVEPNNVYVIPPNVQLEMVDGVIRPAQAERPHGHRITIDIFFRTMAEAYERNAVCIVLSGTGTDGTLGLKRVKESNGFAIVQSPEDAEYDSMPRSAINTQLADWILPVNQMPEKLLGFKESSERMHLTNGADAKKISEEINADESLRDVLTLLRVRTGHDFSHYKTPTLVRRIARHLQIHELEDIPSYLELMRKEPNEIHSLFKNILINVTNFFRDKEAFIALEKEILPKIFEGKTGKDTVRVWSCGCASGEEAYSLAMLLTEYTDNLGDAPRIQVFASDLDDDAIQEAREHRYAESIEADVLPERLKRFFIKEGSFYRIKKELRESVLFASHNVLRDPPFSRLDLISCRNLLIYLNRETQERVLQIFHFALQSGGYLFLGSSETAESETALFAPVDKKQRIYSRRTSSLMSAFLPMMPIAGRWAVPIPERKSDTSRVRSSTLSDIHYRLLEDYAPSSILVNQDFEIVYLSGTAGKFLRFAGGEPSRNILKAVLPDLVPDLRAALFTAQREHKSSEFPNIRVLINGELTAIDLIVRSIDVEDEASDFLLVIFEELNSPQIVRQNDQATDKIAEKDEAMEAIVRRLEEDLQKTKEHLRFTIEQHETTVEELKASNEELQAINEELRSASEELETSKEELQSVNEELTTVNHELKDKIDESGRINSDMQNLIAATEIATIFLDKNLKIKRYTPPVQELFNITPNDVGRPLEHFTHRLRYQTIVKDAEHVLRSLATIEQEIEDDSGRFYLARFVPYRTIDDRIEGVALNFIDITERKQVENLVHEFEARFRAFVKASSDAVYSMNADWSEMRFLEGKDFVPDTANPNTNWLDKYIPHEDRPQVLDVINKAVSTKSIFKFEHSIKRVDGTSGWTFSRAIPLLNKHGEIVEWFGTASDITARKEIEEAVRLSEEKYRLLFNSIDEGFCTIEVLFDDTGKAIDYRFLETNPAFDRQTGLPNAIGKTIRELAPEHEEFWFGIYERIARTGKPERFEHEAAALRKFYDVYAFRIGEPEEHRVAIIFNDIYERKQVEAAVRKSEEQYRTLFNQAVSGIAETDLTGKFIRVNDRYCKIVGYTCEELLTRRMHDITHPDDLTDDVAKFTRLVKSGKPFEIEKRFICKDGRPVWVHDSISAIKDENGQPLSTVAVSIDITESKQAGAALRESEERLRLATEAAKAYTWEFDVRNETYKFSDNASVILGVSRKNLPITIEDAFNLVYPDDKPLLEKTLTNAIRTGEGFALDLRTVTQKGKIVWLAVQSAVVKDEKEKPARIIGIAQNITERKHAEEMLRESEERMRIAIEAGELATWEWDIENERVYWNERHFKLFGMKPKNRAVKPEDFFYHVHPDDRERVGERLNEAIEKKIPFEAEFRALIEGDGVRWMNGYGRVTETDKDGKATRMSGVMFEITKRKQAEVALRKSEEQVQLILESTRDYAIITFDLKGFITRWNTGAERIFGYTEKEAVGRHCAFLFTPEDQAQNVPELEMQTALEKGRAEDERWHLRKDGSRFFASGVMQPLKDSKIEGFVKITRDQTEKLKAETALREKEMLRHFVRTQEDERHRIARDLHDHLGQQLTALRFKIDNLSTIYSAEESPNKREAVSLIEELQEATQQIDRDIDFLAWELRPLSLDDLGLRLTLVNFIREWAKYSGVKTDFHTLGLGRIELSRETETTLYRITQESLNNIHKHARAENVSVLLERRKENIMLIIEDDGIGFAGETDAISQKGLGVLGMKERAALLGGTFEIESESGKGTTIFVRIPLHQNTE